MSDSRRMVVGVSGATGTVYAVRLLELARQAGIETHVVLSDAAKAVARLETDANESTFAALAHRLYGEREFAAGPASGSWRSLGMVVCPCSMASLAAIANGLGTNLLHRAADVTLKERRPLVLVVRESPYNRIHLENMLKAHDAGATILPASPGFYGKPAGIPDLVDQIVGRILDHIGVAISVGPRWETPELTVV